MNGPFASNRLAPTALVALIAVASFGCGRLRKPERPVGVPAGAERERKTGMWTLATPTSFTQYFADGTVATKGTISHGSREGEWRAWSMDGKVLISVGNYQRGRRDGLWKHFDDRGRLYLVMHYAPKPARDFFGFSHPDYGNENGPYERFFPDGRLEERGEFRGGFYHGPVVRYHWNGRVAMRGEYRKDQMYGTWTYYYPEGARERTEPYLDGLLEGRVANYHPDGSVYQEALFHKGSRISTMALHPRAR